MADSARRDLAMLTMTTERIPTPATRPHQLRRNGWWVLAGISFISLPLIGLTGCGGGGSSGGISGTLETVVEGLNNPTGIAIRGDGTIIVAESGAGRLITVAADGSTQPLATDFMVGSFFPYDIGPLAVLILEDGTLVVGEGGDIIGRERVSFFTTDGAALSEMNLSPVVGGNYSALALDPVDGALYFTSANTNAIFLAAAQQDQGFDQPESFIADTTADPIGFSAPSSLTFDADGTLLVGFSGFDGAGIVRLAPVSRGATPFIELVYFSTGMVTSLTVRPSDGAVIFSEFNASNVQSGRVAVIAEPGAEVATLIGNLTGPSAVAFDSAGSLYVATLGDPPNGNAGSVLKLPSTEAVEMTDTPPPAPEAVEEPPQVKERRFP